MYSLNIVSKTDSGSNVVAVDAVGEYSHGALALKYAYDGAEYTLYLKRGEMIHDRRGDVSLKMEFKKGKKTLCLLEDSTGKGSFEIFTEELEVDFDKGACKAVCVYSDDGGETKTTLTVTATPVNEG